MGRDTLGDGAVDCRLHRRQQDKGGKAEAQRGHQHSCCRSGTVKIGQRGTCNRIGGARHARGEASQSPPRPCQKGKTRGRSCQKTRRQQDIARSQQCERGQRGEARNHDQDGRTVPCQRADPRSHQRHCRKLPCAQKRRRGKDQRHQQGIAQGKRQRPRCEDDAPRNRQQPLQNQP